MARITEIQYDAADLLFYAQEKNMAMWNDAEQALSDNSFYDNMYRDKVYIDYDKVFEMPDSLYRRLVIGFFEQEGIDTGIYFVRD